MSAKISLERNFKSLPDLTLVGKDDMREVGLLARERIVRRTLRGQGVDEVFAAYSPGYAEMKRAALGTSQVNLQVSGNMLNDLTIVDLTNDSVTLGWNK